MPEIKLRLSEITEIGKVKIFHAKPGPTAASDRSGAPKRGGSELHRVTPRPPPSLPEDVATAGVDRVAWLGSRTVHAAWGFFFFFFFFSGFFSDLICFACGLFYL